MDSQRLRSFLECPICYAFSPDTHLLICRNGHNICSSCRSKVEQCPVGRCDYDDEPPRNRMAESMLDNGAVQLEFPCKFDCGFVGKGS